MLRVQLAQARTAAGTAIAEAQGILAKIREKQAANESTTELDAQFEAANQRATSAINEVNRLDAALVLEQQAARLADPENAIIRETQSDRQPARLSFKERQQARREAQRMRQQVEMFSRAGVKNTDDFLRFRDAHAESFSAFIANGNGAAMQIFEQHGFKPLESMALVSKQGDLGGYLVPDEFRAEVLRDLAGMAVMRGMCRVMTTGAPALVFPTIQSATTDSDIYATGYTGSWKQEGYVTGGTAPTVQNQPTFGQSRIPVYAWAPNAIEVTQELLGDSAADLDSVLAEVIAETLALDEDAVFINGTGAGQSLGIMNDSGISSVNSGSASALTYDGLITLFSTLPAQYRQNARWLMNSLTFGAILKLKGSTNDHPILGANVQPGTLWGKTIAFSEFMPDVSSGTKPIMFGDFRYYGIADRQELRVQRLVERYAPNVGLLPTARVGGQVLRSAAFKKQNVSA